MAGGSFLLDMLNRPKAQPLPTGSGPWSKNLTSGFGGGGGGSSSTSTSNTSYNKSVTPFILPQYTGLMDQLRKQMESRLAAPSALPKGYEESGLRQINDTYRGGETAVTNQLIGRGLLGSPAEATAFAQQFALPRMSDMSGFRANLPIQERQFRNEDWGMLMSLLDTFGKGQNEKGSSTTTTNSSSQSSGGGGGGGGQIQPGLNLGQAQPSPWSNLLSMVGYLVGSGAFHGGSRSSGSGSAGAGAGGSAQGVIRYGG